MSQSNSSNSLGWTNRIPEDATKALNAIEDLMRKYGMQLMLEALIEANSTNIIAAQIMQAEDDYLLLLEKNLKTALEEYKNRHNEFPK